MDDITTQVKHELGRIAANVSAGLNAGKERDEALLARMRDLEQRAARGGGASFGGGGSDALGLGLRAAIENADGLDDLRNGQKGRVYIDLPSHFFATPRAALTGADQLGQTDRATAIAPLPMQRITLRSLLPTVPTTAAAVQYLAETGSPGPAEVVTEGATKPDAGLRLELKTAPVVTIAVYQKASTQILSDIDSLMAFIDVRLRYLLSITEEGQLLSGSGIGNNLLGLMTAASTFSDATTASDRTITDTIRRAIADLESNGYAPSAIVLNPNDFAEIELSKDDESRYLVGMPRGPNPSSLWQTPVVRSPTMNAGNYLVGDLSQAALLHDRWAPRIEVATTNEDDFLRNIVAIRCEARMALAVHQPAALRKGTF